MKFSTFLMVAVFGVLLLSPGLASAKTIDVTIKGVDDGVRTSKQQDYKEALLHAKLQAIERAGVKIESITRVVNFQIKFKQVETKAKAVLLPGFQVIDIGYTEDGSYQVVLSGKLRVGGAAATGDVPAMQMDPVDAPYMILQKSNIRKAPHGAAERIYVLAAGTEVFVLGISKDRTWAAIEYKGKGLGYVPLSVLQKKGAYLAEQARKRKKAEETARILRELDRNMVVIPAGSFRMGDLSGGGDNNEKPTHPVTIPRPFAVGKYEVTQAEWRAVMGSNPSHFKGDRNPVEQVSWDDAQDFVRRLGTKTGKQYRLLTEAEWEYAARAGTATEYFWGNGFDSSRANNNGNRTVPVGRYAPNSFGLHDMHGNVWEWVEDCWHTSYRGAPSGGDAWTTGGNCRVRVLRGGSWSYIPGDLRSAIRYWGTTDDRDDINGFRVARTL